MVTLTLPCVGVEDKDPVLWMHFLPFAKMADDDRNEFQMVLKFMREHSELHNPIYSNGACIRKDKTTKKIVGTMYGAGWRGAQVPSK